MKFKKIGLLLMCFGWIHAAQAQQNNFCADYKFICKGGIDEKGIGLGSNDKTFCYQWDNPKLLDFPNSENPKIKVALNEKTIFNVTVTTPEGDKYEDKITVLVYTLDLEISLPKIDGGAAVAEADEQTIGSQTFINIDNDDADATPDLNDNLVQGGDNELMKLKGKIKFYPDAVVALKNNDNGTDLSTGAERSLPKPVDFTLLLKATKGDKNIALWKFDTKEIPIAKNNGIYSFPKTDLIPDLITNEFFFERWIEGIEGNNETRGTELALSFDDSANATLAPSAACATDVVACTIAEITSVKWLGMDNGALADEAGTKSNDFTGDYLDADTEYGATNSVRVFPDGRLVGGVVGTSRNTVRIKVEVKPNFAIATKVYLRAFDMDDPSQNKKDVGIVNRPEGGRLILDPNDDGIAGTYDGGTGLTYDMHNDNRGLVKGRKFGSTFPDSSKMDVMGKFTISFPVGANVNNPDTTKFQVSEFAGDNYVLFAASDKAHLLHLENKDELDSDTIKDVSSGRKLPIDKGVKSNILTVWRLLHLEYDSMRNFAWGNNNNGNYETSGVISSLVNAGAGAAIGNSQEALSGDIGFSNIGLMPYDIDPSLFYSNLGQA